MTVPKSHREAGKEVAAHPGRAFACSHPKLQGLLRLGAPGSGAVPAPPARGKEGMETQGTRLL